jgi:hypothetical protein
MGYTSPLGGVSARDESLDRDEAAKRLSAPRAAGTSAVALTRSASKSLRWERVAHAAVGLGFGAAAIGNLIGFLPRAGELLPWFAETAWFPPYGWLLHRLLPVAPLVVVAGAAVEVAIAAMLLKRRHVALALGLATGWLLGLIPAVGWPYWTPNLLAGIGLALLWRRNCARRQMAASPHG